MTSSQPQEAAEMLDLGPAARQMAALVGSVPDTMLRAPTPCPDYALGDLIDHVGELVLAFTNAATKVDVDRDVTPPPLGDASRLAPDWRTQIPRDLTTLADAWRDPDAWGGMTSAGGIEMPGEVAGLVALDELVLHGWDVARALGRPFNCDETLLRAVHGFVQQSANTGGADDPDALFGPIVPVAEDAPLLHRVVGLAGRDPSWSADRD